jgi:hypothetical protein
MLRKAEPTVTQVAPKVAEMEGDMGEYPWQAQYDAAVHAPDFVKCIVVAQNKIYDRLEDYLQGRQHIDAAEWHAIKEALCFLRNVQHEIPA